MHEKNSRTMGQENMHIENIDKGDFALAFMPNMLKEHKMRYQLLAEVIKSENYNDKNKPTIVDIGSARGLGTEMLSEDFPEANIIGLEIGLKYIRRAMEKKKLKKEDQPHYANADAIRSPLASNSVDAIAMFEILEHVSEEDQSELLAEVFRLVKEGGTVMVSIPFPYSFDGDGNRMGASSNPNHLYEPTMEELVRMVKEQGFEIIDRYGQSFATQKGVEQAKKLERKLNIFNIPAWTMFGINMNFLRNPKPIKMDEAEKEKIPLTQILVLKKKK